MTKYIYKCVITSKHGYAGDYITYTDEYYLPSVKACMGALEAYTNTSLSVTVENIEIKRMKVLVNATI